MKSIRPVHHVYFLLIYIAFGVVLKFSRNPNYLDNLWSNLILDIVLINFPDIVAFYLSSFVYSKLLPKIGMKLILCLMLVFIVYTLIWYYVDYWIAPAVNVIFTPDPNFDISDFAANIFYIYIEFNLLAFGFQYFNKSLDNERQLTLVQNEKLEIEAAFLRAQINPHFLNNTLNFFYAKSLAVSTELSNGFMSLSEIMRYALQTNDDSNLIPLEQEVEHIQNIIAIYQLRSNGHLNIDLKFTSDAQDTLIMPLVLVFILEHILKHGDCYNLKHPVLINIKVDKNGNQKVSATYRSVRSFHPTLPSTAIRTLRTRLEKHYGAAYNLSLNNSQFISSIKINIPN